MKGREGRRREVGGEEEEVKGRGSGERMQGREAAKGKPRINTRAQALMA